MRDGAGIIDDIGDAASVEDVWMMLVRRFRDDGFDAVAYLIFDHGKPEQAPVFFERGYDPAVVDVFTSMGYGRNAPALRVAMTNGAPMLAGQIEGAALTPAERAHRAAIMGAGLTETLILPVFGPRAHDGAVMLAKAARPDLFDRPGWRQLQAIAQSAHLRTLEVALSIEPAKGLSERETEILWFIAQGKSNGVIAQLLELSLATVDTYVRRIFEKLDVADRTSAAVKAVSRGLIRI